MNKENIKVFIDFGSSKIRLGVFSNEISKSTIILEEDCISNLSLKNLNLNDSKEVINNLIKSAEKKINMHIKNINLMTDSPDIFSIDFSIKNSSDKKKYSKKDVYSLINEAKSIVQKNYVDQKIIHVIIKKFSFDNQEFFEIPECEGCLETILSNFCILHTNQIIQIEVLNKKYHILVTNVEPDWEKIDFDNPPNLDDNIIEIKDIDLTVEINNKFLQEENKNKTRNHSR